MFPLLRPVRQPRRLLPLLLAAGLGATLCPRLASAQSLFQAEEVVQERFVLVAAPIGSSNRYQLNIYEQVSDRRPCFAVAGGMPAAVNPLLASFDFTGICSRYIDANGYSVRVGGTDLATSYRLLVRNDPAAGTLLVALPTKPGAGPEMVVARSGGVISGFHRLHPEPGWRLMRRQFGGRRLGHLYLYSEAWPAGATPASSATSAAPVSPPSAPAAPAPMASPGGASPGSGASSSGAVAPPVAPPRL